MILLIWIILLCIGLDPISAFVVALVLSVIIILMEDEPRVVNNYYQGAPNDNTSEDE